MEKHLHKHTMYLKNACTLIGFLYTTCITAQIKNTDTTTSHFQINGHLETYYNFSPHTTSEKIPFLSSYNYLNTYRINFINLSFTYQKKTWQFVYSLMHGTYTIENMKQEKDFLKNTDRCFIQYRFSDRWQIDAGIIPSHIGYETNYGKDNFFASRLISSDNAPYFETGIRLTYYAPNKQWEANINLLHGWQNILYQINNQFPATGYQILFKPNKQWKINNSLYIAYMKAEKSTRIFHDFFVEYTAGNFITVVAFDIGYQKELWNSFYILFAYRLSPSVQISAKYELFNDPSNIIINTPSSLFKISNYSLNLNLQLMPYLQLKTEYRYFTSPYPVLFNTCKLPVFSTVLLFYF